MRLILLPILILSLLGAGCIRKKAMQAALPVPSQSSLAKPAPVLQLPPSIAPIETPAQEPPVKTEEPPPAPETSAPAVPKQPPPRRPRPTAPLPVAPAPEASAAPPPEPAPQPTPQLRELLTPQQRNQYERDLSKNVAEARLALNRASRHKQLTPAQRENVSRIQTFLTQAQASRKDDLGTSLQLARRAALLGQELMKSLLP